jgi:hypothetical protein
MNDATKTVKAQAASGSRPTRAPLPRRRFFDDMPDKGLFGFIAVFGFGMITALKIYNYDSDIVAGFAVVLMLVYGLIAYRIPEVSLRLDRLGDNFYYLGFIYTLASLSAALVQLRADPDITAILGSFGIALVTTIVGVAGRVLFAQMRTEIEEVEEAIRRDLADASNALKALLSQSLRDFETFHTSLQQVANETVGRMGTTIDAQVGLVGDAAQAIADKISAAFQENEEHAKAHVKATKAITSAIDKLLKRLDAVELPTERLEKQLSSIGNELEELLKRVSAALDDVANRLNAMNLPTKRIEEQIDKIGSDLERKVVQHIVTAVEEAEKRSHASRRWRLFGG